MPSDEKVERGAIPVRGTQSFVGVMGAVWSRPSLMALEVLWRWAVGLPLFAVLTVQAVRISKAVHFDTVALGSMTVFQPVAAFGILGASAAKVLPMAWPVARWLLPISALVWMAVAAFGRTLVLRRYDRRLSARPFTLFVLGAIRATLLGLVWALWICLIAWAGRIAITGPAAQGGEPNIVLYCALLICGTLFFYVLWAICSWPFQLAPLLAMAENLPALRALRASVSSHTVRGKLIEINLVMNIVKIAVLVLAMVFSASPLPFSSVETQTFLNIWWCGVIVLYLATLDYFHVVRAAAFLGLWRALAGRGALRDEDSPAGQRFTL